MQRQATATLHRQRDINSQDRMIDRGTAEEMVMRVMDQPRVMRSQYTIMQDELVYQPDQIQIWAREFGHGESSDAPIPDDGIHAFGAKL